MSKGQGLPGALALEIGVGARRRRHVSSPVCVRWRGDREIQSMYTDVAPARVSSWHIATMCAPAQGPLSVELLSTTPLRRVSGIGASWSLPRVLAKVGLPKRERLLGVVGGNASSCSIAAIDWSQWAGVSVGGNRSLANTCGDSAVRLADFAEAAASALSKGCMESYVTMTFRGWPRGPIEVDASSAVRAP